jgi:hypothetical protein
VAEGDEGPQVARPAATAAPRAAGRRAPLRDTAPTLDASTAHRSAEAVARAYGLQSINWTAVTLARQYRRLAVLAVGPLAEQNRVAADDRGALAEVRSDGAGQRGRVRGVKILGLAGDRMRVGVRTSELAYGRSLGRQRERDALYLATLEHRSDGWRVVDWNAQP